MTDSNTLVSVIIPSYNQAQFLGEAIESVLLQSYPHYEIFVVDDGSPDNSTEIVARYPGVRLIRQEHQGTSVARNRGLRESRGQYLVFLDGDDRLLPTALEVGIKHLLDHESCAFVFGIHREIAADGSLVATPLPVDIGKDYYARLLLSNYVFTPCNAMFRRSILEKLEGFSPTLKGAEDYELYLRITRLFPIFGHGEVVADYRRHGSNMTRNTALMLKVCLEVLHEQKSYVQGNKLREEAYRDGIKNWQRIWGEELVSQVWARTKQGKDWERSVRDMFMLMRYAPGIIPRKLGRRLRRSLDPVVDNKEPKRSPLN